MGYIAVFINKKVSLVCNTLKYYDELKDHCNHIIGFLHKHLSFYDIHQTNRTYGYTEYGKKKENMQ